MVPITWPAFAEGFVTVIRAP